MAEPTPPAAERDADQVAELARQRPRGFVRELMASVHHNKKWWMLPVILALLVVGLFVIVAGTAAAPLIYTLF